MNHEMKLKSLYFDKIKNGEKIYEIRLNDEKRKIIDVGDIIIFKRKPALTEQLITEVTDLIYFQSFDDMINTLPLGKVGFENATKQNVKDIYRQFYDEDSEQKYGVVAIKIKLIGNDIK